MLGTYNEVSEGYSDPKCFALYRKRKMAETTKQITFAQKTDEVTGRTTYRIKRLLNMHTTGLMIGKVYPANDFKTQFAKSSELQGVDIILE